MEFVLLFLLNTQFYQNVALKDDLLRKKCWTCVLVYKAHFWKWQSYMEYSLYQLISQSELLYIV